MEHLELLCTARLGDEFESMLWEESKICPEDPVADDAMRLVLGLNLGVSEAYIDGVWTVYDVDGNGVLDVDEFSRLYETMLASNMQHKYPQRNS